MKKVSSAVFLFFLLCSSAPAIPITYQLNGTYYDQDYVDVYGSLVIDSEPTPCFGCQWPDFFHHIVEYDILSGELYSSNGYFFLVDNGVLNIESEYPDPQILINWFQISGATNWGDLDRDSRTGSMYGSLRFYYEDGSSYPLDINLYQQQLAPIINLESLNSLTLTMNAAPVPEPATIILIVSGLIGTASLKHKRFIKS